MTGNAAATYKVICHEPNTAEKTKIVPRVETARSIVCSRMHSFLRTVLTKGPVLAPCDTERAVANFHPPILAADGVVHTVDGARGRHVFQRRRA